MYRPLFKWLAAFLIVLVILPPLHTQAEGGEHLRVVSDTALTERLHEIVLDSPALGKQTPLRVLLPKDYDEHAKKKYPVLYMLHGCCGDYKSWTVAGDIENMTKDLPLVIVMPDAGRGGSYSNWYNNGSYGKPQWEDYHIKELIPWVEQAYQVKNTREGRAIAGLSMGGFGSLSYAARHPDLFLAAASFSGVINTNLDPVFLDKTIFQNQENVPPGTVWGDRETHEIIWRSHNPWDLAENLDGVNLSIYTGTGEAGGPLDGGVASSVEEICYSMSTSLHNRLEQLNISHEWNSYGPGSHTWGYWKRDLEQTLPRFMTLFAHPTKAPMPFSYKSAETSFSIYGWSVQFNRVAEEFAELQQVSKNGFTITGSGTAEMKTAAWYNPHKRYLVKMHGKGNHQTIIIKPDRNGKLKFDVKISADPSKQEKNTIEVIIRKLG
ncbi:alpha/beta hydrolase [Fictibacillus fluitans]|uniref:Alpha/beta hydrolase family protein n=1 Tax=Fictibacillus fluitans TaxID=3058422 RepID=A0ABT8I0R6_9BACL|nr:alpha/beta hydrolase family protein [Fictibacillus sp. NE201]MDN4526310.1 alpha/beta hydrolase family protein [Fictibacillus sp. NE201]